MVPCEGKCLEIKGAGIASTGSVGSGESRVILLRVTGRRVGAACFSARVGFLTVGTAANGFWISPLFAMADWSCGGGPMMGIGRAPLRAFEVDVLGGTGGPRGLCALAVVVVVAPNGIWGATRRSAGVSKSAETGTTEQTIWRTRLDSILHA